jgi:hypothetical protein
MSLLQTRIGQPGWISLRLEEAARLGAHAGDFVLVVDVSRQELHVLHESGCLATHAVSTSRYGLGSQPGSHATPTGWHRVRDRYGLDEPLGRVFRDRRPQPEVAPLHDAGEADLILTRILHLEGLEPGHNDTSFARFIYLHGTNREDRLGTPASLGCVRLGNRALAALFNLTLRSDIYCWIGTLDSG